MVRSLLMALLLLPLVGQTQTSVYRTTDDKGNVVFTDTPSAGTAASERVEVRQPNTAPPPPARAMPEPQAGAAAEAPAAEAIDWQVAITAPANETTIPMGPGNFAVAAEVSPALEDPFALQLYLDGEAQGAPARQTLWNLTNVSRGAHDLTVSVVDAEGETLATSTAVRVYVFRPTANRGRALGLPTN